MRRLAGRVDIFAAGSRYYAGRMEDLLRLDRGSVHVISSGIDPEGYAPAPEPPSPRAIGFLSRMCRERGLDLLAEAFIQLKSGPDTGDLRLMIAGGMTSADRPLVRSVRGKLHRAGVSRDVSWLGDFDRSAKRRFLPRLTVMSVPDRGRPSSALFVAESLMAGVPVAVPSRGVFPELVELTGGGVCYEPDRGGALAGTLGDLVADPQRAHGLGMKGRGVALRELTAAAAAAKMAELLGQVS